MLGNLECFSTLWDSIYRSLQVGDANYWGRLVYGVSELRIRNWLGLTLPLIMSADIVTPQRGNARISDRLMG